MLRRVLASSSSSYHVIGNVPEPVQLFHDGSLFTTSMRQRLLPVARMLNCADASRELTDGKRPPRAHEIARSAPGFDEAVRNQAFVRSRHRQQEVGHPAGDDLDDAVSWAIGAGNLGKLMGYVVGHGVLMIPCGRYTNVMRVMPSLTIPRSLLFKALDIFGDGLRTL